ncbi:hypothetical protein [Bdellovibrio sp. HCB337]|uniref:hypothetical protein n=1 Tax=Bdellovibrio sp. HCB337 TaxID=3394358 RepID=UPI0039A689C5
MLLKTVKALAFSVILLCEVGVAATESLGPGVTGGGDSCKQQMSRSFSLLTKLFQNGKIDLSNMGVGRSHALSILSKVKFKYSKNLTKGGVPVEMLNVFGDNIIIVDRKICHSYREPLGTFTPLLLHEVIRLMGLDDGSDYKISNQFQKTIRLAVTKELGATPGFLLIDGSATAGEGVFALGWGFDSLEFNLDELLDLPIDAQYVFVDKNKKHLVNYLVYLPTMRTLAVLREKEKPYPAIYSLYNITPWGPHLELKYAWDTVITVGTSEDPQKSPLRYVEGIFALHQREEEPVELIAACQVDCDKLVREAVFKVLNSEQKKIVSSYPKHFVNIETNSASDAAAPFWVFLEAYDPQGTFAQRKVFKADLNVIYDKKADKFTFEVGPAILSKD